MHALQVETLGFNPWHSVVFPSTTRSKLSPLEAAPKHHRICSTKKLIHLHVCGRMCAHACIQSLRKSRRLNAIFNLLKVSLRYHSYQQHSKGCSSQTLLGFYKGSLSSYRILPSPFTQKGACFISSLRKYFLPHHLPASPRAKLQSQSKAPVWPHYKMASRKGSLPLASGERVFGAFPALLGQLPGSCRQDTSDWGFPQREVLPGPQQGASVPWRRAGPALPGGRMGFLGQQMSRQENKRVGDASTSTQRTQGAMGRVYSCHSDLPLTQIFFSGR